jgi:hypothetical protein
LGTTVAATLTTSCSPDVIMVLIGENTARGAAAISSTPISSGLTFTLRSAVQTGTMWQWEYYAVSNGPLTSQVITEVMSQPTAFTVTAFGVCGANVAAPFDTSPRLPGTAPGLWGASHLGTVSTSHANDLIINFDSSQGNAAFIAVNGYAVIETQQVPSWMVSSLEAQVVSSPQSYAPLGFILSIGESGSQIIDAIVSAN